MPELVYWLYNRTMLRKIISSNIQVNIVHQTKNKLKRLHIVFVPQCCYGNKHKLYVICMSITVPFHDFEITVPYNSLTPDA